jgi:hypothetical protein
VTRENVLERNAYWFLIGGFVSIDGVDFCEVTKEDVLERNAYWKLKIGFFLGNLSASMD